MQSLEDAVGVAKVEVSSGAADRTEVREGYLPSFGQQLQAMAQEARLGHESIQRAPERTETTHRVLPSNQNVSSRSHIPSIGKEKQNQYHRKRLRADYRAVWL